jgi:hypothetical protein
MYQTVRFTAMTTLLLWVASSLAHAMVPAKTPDELIRNLVAAAQQGNSNDFLAGLTANSRKAVIDSIANQAVLREAQHSFQQALEERLGKGGEVLDAAPDDLKSAVSRLAAAEILEKKPGPGGTVQLRVRASFKQPNGKTVTREDTLIARAEGGDWKLVLSFAPGAKLQSDSKAALERITKQVEDGQFKDRTSAMVALANNLPGARGTTK